MPNFIKGLSNIEENTTDLLLLVELSELGGLDTIV